MAADYFNVNGVRTCAFSALQWRHDEAAATPAVAPQDLRALLRMTGTVEFPPGTTPRQKALHLLHAAAEVEHHPQLVGGVEQIFSCAEGLLSPHR